MESLVDLRQRWDSDALAVGAIIYPLIPNELRPTWASSVLVCCGDRVAAIPRPVQHVADLAGNPKHWSRAHDAFSAVRRLTLAAERKPPDNLSHCLLYVAENAAKVIYNASRSAAPFDADSGDWLVRCARDFANHDPSAEFPDDLWAVLTALAGRGT